MPSASEEAGVSSGLNGRLTTAGVDEPDGCPSVTLIEGRHAYPQACRHYGPARAAPATRFRRSTPGGRQEHVYGEAGARGPARWICVWSVSKQTESFTVSKP